VKGGPHLNQSAVAVFRYEPDQIEADLKVAFDSLHWRDYIKTDTKVFIKPNFTLPFPKPGVTTSTKLVEAALSILRTRTSEVFVGESDGGYASFAADYSLRNHGIPEICTRTGSTMLNLSAMERTRVSERVNGKSVEVTLPRVLLDMDESLSMPVLKVHVVTGVSLSLKNMWGCHPDTLRLLDHTNLSERLALIARSIHLRFAVVDGIYGLDRRGPMNGDPVKVGAVLVGNNPVATDATATRLMGFRAEKIGHIITASKAGLGPYGQNEIKVMGDLGRFQQHFHLKPTIVDRLGSLTFRSDLLTKLVFDSPITRPIYAVAGREYRRKIRDPGDEL